MNPVLSVRGLDKRFGAVIAADAISVDIAAGQKVSLIGANGAGKTTFVNMVTGYITPDSGSIALDGIDIAWRSPRRVARLGISRSFQIPQLFIELTARKLVDIAMALVRRPKLLLLDEPTSGVSAEEKFATMDRVIHAVAPDAATIVFVEHDMEIVSRYADRVVAFYQGRILADGEPHHVLKDPEVRRYVTGSVR